MSLVDVYGAKRRHCKMTYNKNRIWDVVDCGAEQLGSSPIWYLMEVDGSFFMRLLWNQHHDASFQNARKTIDILILEQWILHVLPFMALCNNTRMYQPSWEQKTYHSIFIEQGNQFHDRHTMRSTNSIIIVNRPKQPITNSMKFYHIWEKIAM